MTCYIAATRPKYKVGDRLLVKLSGGRIVEATIKAIVNKTDGIRLQVSFGDERALIYPWQVVKDPR
jgi:6-phosphogluconolactonase/glucosamine-6-phosphate isomerase/deaminase